MSNPRRRRNVTMAIVFFFVILGQAPNLYFNVFHHFGSSGTGTTSAEAKARNQAQKKSLQIQLDQFHSAQKFVPPLWVPLGAQSLAEGNAAPALLGTLGCFAIGALGLRRAYQGTLRFYRGESGGKVPARIEPTRTSAPSTARIYWRGGSLTGLQASLLCFIFGALLVFMMRELFISMLFLHEVKSLHAWLLS